MDGDGRIHDADADADWVLPCAALSDVTLALVGKIGSGKSATANSILGREAFPSEFSYSGVTGTCQMRSGTFHDGCAARTLNVIDTPGLFDMDKTAENIHREIVKGLDMARDGIHVILMVFSATCRFSQEDEKTVEATKMFLGDKVLDHMILVFTHGDLVGEETSWNKKLTDSAPAYLQDMLNLCKNRVVLFDNKTSNKKYRLAQLRKLLDAVDFVISSNHGKPFSNCTHAHSQKMQSRREISAEDYSTEQRFKLKKEIYDECVAQLVKMVEENPSSTVTRFEKLLLEEHKARLESDNRAAEVILKSEEETRKVKEMLQKINKESENAQKEMEKVKKKVRTLEKIHENKK
ncbi:hypothetical protein QYE76_044158 [Lolium multiflorum]|uniref:AIG1-type G domain-containing protein n=1 Tax=Lolium multiflorum TaxID=4521 RepID=A0AAD8WWH3_LOLMU|nr:immune-associated nucleotide-binding protein 9-like [Lolium rigidum]KAK1683310.1 hypothetical protein QYE76_044158 [Lolium multiflorum]